MTSLVISDYAQEINLGDDYSVQAVSLPEYAEQDLVEALLQELQNSLSRLGVENYEHYDADAKRLLLDSALTISAPFSLSQDGINQLNQLLQSELSHRELKSADTMAQNSEYSVGQTKIVLWQGDITTLKIDAIVNAANNQMLGCFLPQHKCIDNVIHSRAGVQLRNDCQTIMQKQHANEATGKAKVTRAYNLPSKYVIHTVGPIVQGVVTQEHQDLLASSYDSILSITAELSAIRSLAFCAISTGVFGYPIEAAAPVAIQTVSTCLEQNPNQLDTVIFNVFSDKDFQVYQSTLEAML